MHDGKIYPDIYDGTMRAHWDSFLSPAERQALEDWLTSAEPLHPRAVDRGLADPEILALQGISFQDWVTSSPGLSQLAQAWAAVARGSRTCRRLEPVQRSFRTTRNGNFFRRRRCLLGRTRRQLATEGSPHHFLGLRQRVAHRSKMPIPPLPSKSDNCRYRCRRASLPN